VVGAMIKTPTTKKKCKGERMKKSRDRGCIDKKIRAIDFLEQLMSLCRDSCRNQVAWIPLKNEAIKKKYLSYKSNSLKADLYTIIFCTHKIFIYTKKTKVSKNLIRHNSENNFIRSQNNDRKMQNNAQIGCLCTNFLQYCL